MAAMMAAAMMAAQPEPAAGRGQDLVSALRACGSVTPDDRQLACYARTAQALGVAIDDHTVAVVDRETVQRTQRSLFGFVTPKLPLFGLGRPGDHRDEEMKEVRGVVRGVREIGADRFEIRLEDDAVWRNTDPFRRPPRTGDTVTIVKATLGSYFMKVGDGRIGTRCVRAR